MKLVSCSGRLWGETLGMGLPFSAPTLKRARAAARPPPRRGYRAGVRGRRIAIAPALLPSAPLDCVVLHTSPGPVTSASLELPLPDDELGHVPEVARAVARRVHRR